MTLTETGVATVSSVSDGIRSLLGYGSEDFLSASVTLTDLIHPDDQDIADAIFDQRAAKDNDAFNIRLRQANGRIRLIRGECKTQQLDAQANVTLDLLLQDAKSLPRTLEDASKTDNFRAMMENTDDYIYFKDRNHVFTGASQTLVSLCSPAEHWTDLVGQTDYDVFPEEYADIYYRLEKQVFAGIGIAHEIQETLSTDGNKGWVDNRKYPVRDVYGQIIGLYGVARDITQLKLLQTELETSNDELEKRVEERTAEYAAIQLALEDKNKRFSMASEAADLGFWDFDTVTNTFKWDDRMFQIYGRSRLDGDLLAYSRVGRVNDEVVRVNTRELVEDVFALATTTNTQFALNLPDNIPVLQTKKVPLEVVFRNLIGNAIKHHDKPQGIIAISARPLADGFEFEVKDDGPGIPLEHQQRVFAMFQTLKPRDEVEGSGIGLALVKKTVESVGGTITLESDGQHGCVFRFSWPTNIPKEEFA